MTFFEVKTIPRKKLPPKAFLKLGSHYNLPSLAIRISHVKPEIKRQQRNRWMILWETSSSNNFRAFCKCAWTCVRNHYAAQIIHHLFFLECNHHYAPGMEYLPTFPIHPRVKVDGTGTMYWIIYAMYYSILPFGD